MHEETNTPPSEKDPANQADAAIQRWWKNQLEPQLGELQSVSDIESLQVFLSDLMKIFNHPQSHLSSLGKDLNFQAVPTEISNSGEANQAYILAKLLRYLQNSRVIQLPLTIYYSVYNQTVSLLISSIEKSRTGILALRGRKPGILVNFSTSPGNAHSRQVVSLIKDNSYTTLDYTTKQQNKQITEIRYQD